MVKSIISRETPVRTTESLIADLRKQAEETGADVRQQVIAHETLAQLRAERAAAEGRKDTQRVRDLDGQIRQWRGMVDEDVDDQAVPAVPVDEKP